MTTDIDQIKSELLVLKATSLASTGIISTQAKELKELKGKLKEQQDFLKKILSSINKIAKAPKKVKKVGPYTRAKALYKAKKYTEARVILIKIIDNKYSVAAKKIMLHNLGIIEYSLKNYNEAIIYLSRLFTEHTQSGYNANGLYHLARSFEMIKKTEEAKQTYGELLSRYPKRWQSKEAKKRLAKIK